MDLLNSPALPARHPRPTRVDVDLDAISHNHGVLSAHTGTPVMAVLKANAYGHGIGPVAKHLAAAGVPSFGVAYLEEALLIRALGIKVPILVFGGVVTEQIPDFLENDIQLSASSVEKLTHIENAARALKLRAKIHLKIDTGMERIGTHYYSCDPLFDAAARCQHCDIEGVFSHFANADTPSLEHASVQLTRFNHCVASLADRLGRMPVRHIANSAAILAFKDAHLDLVRSGQAMYGAIPAPHLDGKVPLRPAMQWHSQVVFFKVVKPAHPISYGSTWESPVNTRVVTVPVGYADGYPRSLSNRGEVLIRGKRYPIVGRVCMDQIMVNIGDGEAWNGDQVTLVGTSLPVSDVAEQADTIAHDILSSISARVPRFYHRSGEFIQP